MNELKEFQRSLVAKNTRESPPIGLMNIYNTKETTPRRPIGHEKHQRNPIKRTECTQGED
jgi:hypothetical protein